MKPLINLTAVVISSIIFQLFSAGYAQDSETLAKEINQDLRNAEKIMFQGKYNDACAKINELMPKVERLKSADPANKNLPAIESKISRMKSNIERRLGKTGSSVSTAVQTVPQPTAKTDKLPGGVSRSIREIDTAVKKARRVLESTGASSADYKSKQARYEMQTADREWEDIKAKYPESLEHPDVAGAKEMIESAYKSIESFEAQTKQKEEQSALTASSRQEQSAAWMAKFEPYMSAQSGSDKYFISGYTEQPEEMSRRMQLFAELSGLFEQYKETQFPNGKSDELLQMEQNIEYNLNTFKQELISAAQRYAGDIETELKRGQDFLAQNEERVKDGKTMPLLLHEDVLLSISKKIEWIKNLLPGDSRIGEYESGFNQLKDKNSAWREKMISSTVMRPDKFNGDDADSIKDNANNIVKNEFPESEILRTAIVSPQWEEERVVEFTDSTHSAVRYRVTQSVTAQVAAKRDNKCYLYTLNIARDRNSDGTWGLIYGHIMFTDPMLEENVSK